MSRTQELESKIQERKLRLSVPDLSEATINVLNNDIREFEAELEQLQRQAAIPGQADKAALPRERQADYTVIDDTDSTPSKTDKR